VNAADNVFVQVAAVPTHGGLQDAVQLGERYVPRYQDATPNGRLNVLELDRNWYCSAVSLATRRATARVAVEGRRATAEGPRCG
jgi:hypothetical protein